MREKIREKCRVGREIKTYKPFLSRVDRLDAVAIHFGSS